MVDFLIKRPVSVLMTFLALLLLAGQSAQRLPMSLLPDVGIPEITVQLQWPNASARELEQEALRPLRQELLQVNGLRHLESEARQEAASIRLELEYGVEVDYAFMEVNEKIDRAMKALPRKLERPQVIKASAGDIPVVYLQLSLKDSSAYAGHWLEFSQLVQQVIQRRLEQLPELALVDLTGFARPEVFIIPNQEKMRSLGIPQIAIQEALQKHQLRLGHIKVQDRHYQYTVQLDFQLNSIEDIENLHLKMDDRLFRLKDLARIGLRSQNPRGTFWSNGRPAINLALIKKANAKMADLDRSVKTLIQQLEWDYPDLHFHFSQDQTSLLNGAIWSLQQSLLMACVLVGLILFLFTRQWRSALIVGLCIPIALLLSLIFFYALGLSINMISLSGLIMGVGLMVDNAVIVVDNIVQERTKSDLARACAVGTHQVIRPLIASTLTTCLIFLPLILLSGMAGVLFYDQAVAVAIGLGVSLLVSITLIPTLYFNGFKKLGQAASQEEIVHPSVAKWYFYSVDGVLRYPWLVLGLLLGWIGAGWFGVMQLDRHLLPPLEQKDGQLFIDWNEPISLAENQQRIQNLYPQIANRLSDFSALIGEGQYLFLQEGPKAINETQLYLQCSNEAQWQSLQAWLQAYFQRFYPKAVGEFSPSENIFDRLFPQKADLQIAIASQGHSPQKQIESLQSLIQHLQAEEPDLDFSLPPTESVVQLKSDPAQMLLYEVSPSHLHSELKKALSQQQISLLQSPRDRIPVVLNSRPKGLQELINTLHVDNQKGLSIPIRHLLQVHQQEQFKNIQANKAGPYLSLTFNPKHPQTALQSIHRFRAQQPQLDLQISGAYFDSRQQMRELLKVLGIALLLLYFVLAAQFESLLQPLIILLEIPISLTGAIAALLLFGKSLNLLSMIGMIVLTGIIINDSILKVDTINRLRREGLPLIEAIHRGGLKRLHPILMTSLTTILALLPFLWMQDSSAQLQVPLALALIGGTLVGTLVSLYVIPLLYLVLYR
ncbi:MAG: efflux RND transporter permease subunit [Bacteroidota bacterium]